MKSFTVKEAAEAAGGVFMGDGALLDCPVTGVAIDNRRIKPGDLFVAIAGEKNDGHDYIASALEAGAVCALSHKHVEGPHILVPDTLTAFQALASWYRCRFDIKVIGVTGSVGKTTTKEMLYSVLSERFSVQKTEGNFNNQTGVPITLFTIDDGFDAAVVEMGTNHFGEIDRLAAAAKPDYCVFTNIGDAHIEFLGSREGILRAKIAMLAHMRPGGSVFVNGDDPLLKKLRDTRGDCVSFGLSGSCDVRAEDVVPDGLMGSGFTLVTGQERIAMKVPAPGAHMVTNALCAAAVGLRMGMTPEEIKAGVAAYKPLAGRMKIERKNGIVVINDVYNANPSSVKASIGVLHYAKGRTVAVLGDMLELGADSAKRHFDVGTFAAEQGVDVVLCVGPLSKNTCEGAAKGGAAARHFETQEELLGAIDGIIEPGDTVLVKASRGMKLEITVEHLLK